MQFALKRTKMLKLCILMERNCLFFQEVNERLPGPDQDMVIIILVHFIGMEISVGHNL
jgi:hypothetical protein